MPEDKYKIIVEVQKDEFKKFDAERRAALQKDVDDHKSANRVKVEDTKTANRITLSELQKIVDAEKSANQIKVEDAKKTTALTIAELRKITEEQKAANRITLSELRLLEAKVTATYQAELEAFKHGNQLKIKEAISTRKILEGEIKGYNAVLRGEIRKEVEEFKTGELQKRLEFRKSIAEMQRAPVTRLRGEIGSAAYVRQLQSAQTKMLPDSQEFVQTGLLINRYKSQLKTAGVEVKSLTQETSLLNQSVQNFGAGLAGVGLIMFIQKIYNAELESAKFKVALDSFATSNFQGNVKLAEQQLEAFRKATARTVTDKSLVQLSNQASDLGASLHDQTILFALAKDAADKYGTSVEEGFQRVMMATEGNERGLKELGIQKEVYKEIVDRLAKAHGDEIDNLDAATQKRIRLQAIIEAGGTTYEDAINKQQDEADSLEANKVAVDNLSLSWGNMLKFVFPWIEAITNLPGSISQAIVAFNNLNDAVKNTTLGILGMRKEAEKSITVDVNFRTNISELPNSFWSVFYGQDLRLPVDLKPLEAKTGTRSSTTKTSGKSPVKEQREEQEKQLTILEAQRQELTLIQAKIILNSDSELARKELLEDQLKILERIGDLEGKTIIKLPEGVAEEIQRMKNSLAPDRAGKPFSGAAERIPAEELDEQEVKFENILSNVQNITNILGIGADTFVGKLLSGIEAAYSLTQSLFSIVASILTISSGGFLSFLKFGEGGLIEGPSHARGGRLIEAEGGEYMIRKEKVTPHTLPFLIALNEDSGSINLAKRYFDTGGYVSPVVQQEEANKRNSRYVGRYFGSDVTPINLNLQLKGDLDLVKFMDLIADVMPGVNVILDNKNY